MPQKPEIEKAIDGSGVRNSKRKPGSVLWKVHLRSSTLASDRFRRPWEAPSTRASQAAVKAQKSPHCPTCTGVNLSNTQTSSSETSSSGPSWPKLWTRSAASTGMRRSSSDGYTL